MAGREGEAMRSSVRSTIERRRGGEEGVATVVDQSRSAGAEFAVVICVWCSPFSRPASVWLSSLSGWMAGWWYDV